jgi:photosystem II stability/assembly factor-like uncharacterized protein
MDLLILATTDGLIICERDGKSWHEMRRGLERRQVTSAIARQGVILAGTRDGVFRSDDLGRSWRGVSQGLTTPYVRWLAYHPDISDCEFAGTEPAGIFVSHDGGEGWHPCPEVTALRDERGWSLPYSPEAGCVRGLAFNGQRAYAAVEVGGVLVSDDNGETWHLARGSQFRGGFPPPGSVHPDVHSLEVHPSAYNLVYAPTGGGFYRSWDGGGTWELRYRCYCRAIWVDPNDPEHLVLGPAEGVDYNGRIETSRDGGRTWEAASAGLDVPWRGHMVERFAQVGEDLLAVLSNGELLAAPLKTLQWEHILRQGGEVNAVTSMAE